MNDVPAAGVHHGGRKLTVPSSPPRVTWRIAFAVVFFAASGCAPPDYDAMLAEAEHLCLDERYAEAIPLLREVLRNDPENAAAHYYLGRCYLAGDDLRPDIAEGQFQTALALFHRHGGVSPIERFSGGYFEMICHIDSAKSHIFRIDALLSLGMPFHQLRDYLEQARNHVEHARAIKPDAEEVATLDRFLTQLEQGPRALLRQPSRRPGASSQRTAPRR